MLDFFRFFMQPENGLFWVALMAFVGLWVLHIFGLGGEALEAGMEGASVKGPGIVFLHVLFLCFGLLGLFFNLLLPNIISVSLLMKVTLSVMLSAGISWVLAGQISAGFGKIVKEHPNPSTSDFIGCVGKVMSQQVSEVISARISISHERFGFHRVRGRMADGYGGLESGADVRLFEYNENERVYLCVPLSSWPLEGGR
jgi:hypothetical protein